MAGTARRHGWTLRPIQKNQDSSNHTARCHGWTLRPMARTLQTQVDILSRLMCTTHLAPRFYPMGGSYTKIAQKGHGNEREFNHIDTQAVSDTRPKTTEQLQGELLAAGCGRMAEFLAQAP